MRKVLTIAAIAVAAVAALPMNRAQAEELSWFCLNSTDYSTGEGSIWFNWHSYMRPAGTMFMGINHDVLTHSAEGSEWTTAHAGHTRCYGN